MPIDISDYKTKAHSAVMRFWCGGRGRKKKFSNKMDGFADLITDIVSNNGLSKSSVLWQQDQHVSLPGHFFSTQLWDLVVVNEGKLVAAIKLNYQLRGSIDNHDTRDYREVLSMSMELRAAYRQGIFRETRKPFVGYLVLIEDAPTLRKPINDVSPFFPLLPEFRGASYAERINILSEKLMVENLYSAVAVILSPRSASKSGKYSEMSAMTGLKAFVATLAGHVAAEAAM
jgi:hypothetical protein